MTKITLLSALTALLILPSIASAESTADFDAINNNPLGWVRVVTLTTPADGVASHAEQTLTWNVTSVPDGAQRRVYRTLANGDEYMSNAVNITTGTNTITVPAASHNRPVKIQFNSDDIEFDSLSINGVDQLATTPAEGTQGIGQSISESSSDIFGTPGASAITAGWVRVTTLTTTADGVAVSGLEQTLVMNVTYMPAGGAKYRIYKTVSGGGGNMGGALDLEYGANTITVPAVSFNRAVKIQFDNVDVEFDALTINGVNQLATTPAEGTQGQVNSQTISESTDIFDTTANATWVRNATLVLNSQGPAVSSLEQTLVMNVTYIPAGGANYRVYKTTDPATGGGGDFGAAQALALDENTITVPAVSYNRSVKIQFDNVEVEFDALTFNDVHQIAVPAAGTPGNGAPISDSPNVIPVNYNGTLYVATMANLDDGAASQVEQTAVINVTYIPAGGANWSLNSTNELGNYITVDTQYLQIGLNTITVSAVDYDRIVKLRFSSDAIEFDALTFNGVNPLAVDDGGDTVTIANSNLFNAGPDATWVAVLTTAVSQDGTSSRSPQTVVLNVTSLPAGGANYRVYQTSASGGGGGGAGNGSGGGGGVPTTSLVVGENTITVDAVGFDRSVKIEFDSDAVEYDALSVNGAARTIGADAVAVPSVSINGSTLTWTEADGTTLQFSDDLESWTSLPSATSPYSPSTTPDRFYRMISEEEE